jgi:TctA family transporter
MYLWNGIPLIPFVVGLFAIPEIVDMAVKGTGVAIELPEGKLGKGVAEGVRDTFRYFWLTVRCSALGAFIGILPGLGGGIAQWVAYAHATQSAKTAEERAGFGKGDVRGVLGPGAANNSREGGCLIPTVAFGIPAGSSMAILLGAFLLLGILPGPDMLTKHLSLTYAMVWTIVIANIIVVAVSLIFINHLAKLTAVRGNLIIPFILLLIFIGAYTTNNNSADIITMLLSGAAGYFMVRFGWPRPPLILGFIMGNLAENYFYTSVDRYGVGWLIRPGVLIIFCLATVVALYPYITKWFRIQKIFDA